MRVRPALALLLLLAVASAAAQSPTSPSNGPHSPNVAAASHHPDPVGRGESVLVVAELRSTDDVANVTLIHCRVQAYACAPALAMARGAGSEYTGRIPWNGAFFDGVTTVGYQFQLHYTNGSTEQSPVQHVPKRPADLPPDGSVYYYYALAAAESPAPGPFLALAALAFGAALLRGRR